MVRIKVVVLCLSLLLAAAVCYAQEPAPAATPSAPSEPAPASDSNKGRIYFYRIKQYAGSALEPSVYCDDKELARMDNGRYFAVDLEPGKHTCRMGDKQTGFEIDIKAGDEHYAKITHDVGFFKGHGRITLVQKEQGAFELKKVKPLGVSKVKDRTLVTVYEGSENKP